MESILKPQDDVIEECVEENELFYFSTGTQTDLTSFSTFKDDTNRSFIKIFLIFCSHIE